MYILRKRINPYLESLRPQGSVEPSLSGWVSGSCEIIDDLHLRISAAWALRGILRAFLDGCVHEMECGKTLWCLLPQKNLRLSSQTGFDPLLRLPSDNVVARLDRQDVTVAPSEGEEKVSEDSPASCLQKAILPWTICALVKSNAMET